MLNATCPQRPGDSTLATVTPASAASRSGLPLVSVVAPCRNERKYIRRFLDCVLGQQCAGFDLEVVIADGESDDGTRDVLAEYAAQNPLVRVIGNPRKLTTQGLNAAIEASRGDFIVRLDVHAEYPPDYLGRCIEGLERTGADVVGGRVINCVLRPASLAQRIAAALTNHPFGVGGSPFRTRTTAGPADSVAFGAFRREVFERVGLFDERLVRTEDNNMWARIREAGGWVYLDPAIHVYYYPRDTLREFLGQGFRNGFGCLVSAPLKLRMLRPRHLIPLFFVGYVLIAAALMGTGVATANTASLLLGLAMSACYLLPDLVCSLRMGRGSERVPGSPQLACGVFLVAPLFHSAYGCGSWVGLLAVLTGRWRRYLGEPVEHQIRRLAARAERKTRGGERISPSERNACRAAASASGVGPSLPGGMEETDSREFRPAA